MSNPNRTGDYIQVSDVQGRKLVNGFKLSRVGVTGVKKPAIIARGNKTTTLFCTIDVFVDLPSTQKGSHLSRNLEIISELVDQTVGVPVSGLEVLSANICRQLREKHEYATYAEVNAIADYFLERKRPNGRMTMESYQLMAKAISRDGNILKKMIGVEVVGMTSCPCAMEQVKEDFKGEVAFGENLPAISHNQRNVATVMMEVPEHFDIEANDLIDLVEDSFSSPTFEILKRSEEAQVVLQAHQKPKFVEDVVRSILSKILENYKHLQMR